MSTITHNGARPPSSTHIGSAVIRHHGVKSPSQHHIGSTVRRNHRDLALEEQIRIEKLRRASHCGDDRGAPVGGYGRLPGSKPRLFKWLAKITR